LFIVYCCDIIVNIMSTPHLGQDGQSNPEVETHRLYSDAEYYQLVTDSAKLMRIGGIDVAVVPRAGHSCTQLPDRILITVDPYQLLRRELQEDQSAIPDTHVETTPDPRFVIHTVHHELGHAHDMLDDPRGGAKMSSKEHFFSNVLDDMVIDRRNRAIPVIDECTEELYAEVLFPGDNYTGQPKHVQLMHGALIAGVTTNPLPKMDDEVIGIINNLTAYVPNPNEPDEIFNVLRTMALPSTDIVQRRSIARRIIWPEFERLYQSDLANRPKPDPNQPGQQSEQSGSGNPFEGSYEKYEDAMHGGHGHKKDGEPKPGDNAEAKPGEDAQPKQKEGEGNPNPSLHEVMSEAVKKLLEGKANEHKDIQGKDANQRKKPEQGKETKEQQISRLAGSIAGPMELSKGDALAYARAVVEWRPEINQVARAFQKLALPTITSSSPRYNKQPVLDGQRLHPNRLGQAGIQIATGQELEIWQTTSHTGKRERLDFGGLDISLIVDLSTSMKGEPAACAAAVSVQLLEGLEQARRNIKKQNHSNKNPDVRIQIIGFGSDTEVLAPLSFVTKPADKGKAFTNLSKPTSDSTIVDGSLKLVSATARKYPKRQQLAIVVSDGLFYDLDAAKQTEQAMTPNVTIVQMNIDGDSSDNLGTAYVTSPKNLPGNVSQIIRRMV
jgi:hypothetical protein